MQLGFVVPANLSRPTGGNRYDQALADALTQLGAQVELRPVPGQWPVASPEDRAYFSSQLTGPAPVLVDGLVACGAPDQVEAAVAGGGRVYVLVHMPLALDTALDPDVALSRNTAEGKALRAATGVVATSAWTAANLRARHGVACAAVAPPGADRAAVARGSDPPLLLHLASVSPVKNQLTVVHALALLANEPWTARLTGALDVDRAYTAAVEAAIDQHGLADRVHLTGPLTSEALGRLWNACDLLLLPSRAETWGMAVTEGLARAIPALVSAGTGAEEALGRAPGGELPGAVADPRSPRALADAIRDLLGPGRQRARRAAADRRRSLLEWRETAVTVGAVICRA
jgi:glycosyltransferase involved in cell wall biosynthesis